MRPSWRRPPCLRSSATYAHHLPRRWSCRFSRDSSLAWAGFSTAAALPRSLSHERRRPVLQNAGVGVFLRRRPVSGQSLLSRHGTAPAPAFTDGTAELPLLRQRSDGRRVTPLRWRGRVGDRRACSMLWRRRPLSLWRRKDKRFGSIHGTIGLGSDWPFFPVQTLTLSVTKLRSGPAGQWAEPDPLHHDV
jgi:hypothetical protein